MLQSGISHLVGGTRFHLWVGVRCSGEFLYGLRQPGASAYFTRWLESRSLGHRLSQSRRSRPVARWKYHGSLFRRRVDRDVDAMSRSRPRRSGATGSPAFRLWRTSGRHCAAVAPRFLAAQLDNSSGGQTYVSSKLWGPLTGQTVHFSYGAGTYFMLLRDEVRGQPQGAIVPMPGDFASGAHRGRFHPRDGQLYVTGMSGWGTYTAEDGSFERVRYTGQPVQLLSAFHVHQNGIRLSFTAPVDSNTAGQSDKQFAQAWNYRYSGAYGSAEYGASHFGTVGHDRLMVAGSHVLEDGRSIFLEIPDLQPVNQLHLRLQVNDGRPIDVFATVHAMDEPFTGFAGYQPAEKIIAAHPILADLTMLANPPRPIRSGKPLPTLGQSGSRQVRI